MTEEPEAPEELEDPIVTIYKVHRISSAHKLDLPYKSKCNTIHGHNWKVEIWLTGTLDEYGMVVDFHELKKTINELDHINLTERFEWQTTAENLSLYFTKQIAELAPDRLLEVNVRVWETETAYAEYTLNP